MKLWYVEPTCQHFFLFSPLLRLTPARWTLSSGCRPRSSADELKPPPPCTTLSPAPASSRWPPPPKRARAVALGLTPARRPWPKHLSSSSHARAQRRSSHLGWLCSLFSRGMGYPTWDVTVSWTNTTLVADLGSIRGERTVGNGWGWGKFEEKDGK